MKPENNREHGPFKIGLMVIIIATLFFFVSRAFFHSTPPSTPTTEPIGNTSTYVGHNKNRVIMVQLTTALDGCAGTWIETDVVHQKASAISNKDVALNVESGNQVSFSFNSGSAVQGVVTGKGFVLYLPNSQGMFTKFAMNRGTVNNFNTDVQKDVHGNKTQAK